MRKYQLRLLAWTFSAFLPKDGDTDGGTSPEDDDYYHLLGISRSATAEDIRKAYKKKSLQLHPDKIAQRAAAGNKTEEEIRRDFQHIKEAYETLSDPKKREIYDGLGPLGMKFIHNPQSAMDPHTLLENLSKSSFCDRTKLFGIVLTLVLLVLMQPILICAKIDQDLKGSGTLADSSWAAILAPLWFLDAVFLVLFTAARVIGPTAKLICTILLEIFLALKWDETVSWSYAIVLIPLYLLEVVRIISCLYWIRKVSTDILRMVTIEMLEEVIIPKHYSGKGDGDDEENGEEKDEENGDGGGGGDGETRLYADLTEEERDEINDVYIIVHVPPDVEAAAQAAAEYGGDEIDHDEQIAQSPEYKAAMEVGYTALRAIRSIIVIHVTTIVLLVLKADGMKNYSWWIVSVPLWIQIGLTMVSSCLKCCTAGAGMSGEEELLAMAGAGGGGGGEGEGGSDDRDENDDESNEEPLVPPASSGTAAAADTKEEKKDNVSKRDDDELPTLHPTDGGTDDAGQASEEKLAEGETKRAVDEDALKQMKISELKSELESYGISTTPFVEKKEFVQALSEAQASGMPKKPIKNSATNDDEAGSGGKDDDSSSGVYIDEETYRAWASAQAANEAKASEIAAKACSRCCAQVFWAMMLALFVAKLAGEDVDSESTGANSYSSFWILFPFLLMAGIFLCCCCCSIYCASNVEGLEENMRQSMMNRPPGGVGDEEAPAAAAAASAEASDAPFIPMPPAPAPAPEAPTQSDETTAPKEEAKQDEKDGAATKIEVPGDDDAESEASDDLD